MAEEEDNTGIATVSFTEEPEMEVYGEVRVNLFLFSFWKCTLVNFFPLPYFFHLLKIASLIFVVNN